MGEKLFAQKNLLYVISTQDTVNSYLLYFNSYRNGIASSLRWTLMARQKENCVRSLRQECMDDAH